MASGYPVFEWIPGTLIDNEDDIQGIMDMDEGDSQGALYTDSQSYQDTNKS